MDVVVGGVVCETYLYIRRHIRFGLAFRNLVNSFLCTKTLQHFDDLGMCISMCILLKWVVCVCTYQRGLGVACSVQGQYQSLEMRNSSSASPAFFVSILFFFYLK